MFPERHGTFLALCVLRQSSSCYYFDDFRAPSIPLYKVKRLPGYGGRTVLLQFPQLLDFPSRSILEGATAIQQSESLPRVGWFRLISAKKENSLGKRLVQPDIVPSTSVSNGLLEIFLLTPGRACSVRPFLWVATAMMWPQIQYDLFVLNEDWQRLTSSSIAQLVVSMPLGQRHTCTRQFCMIPL